MNLTLKVWRQQSANAPGNFASYEVRDITPDMSFLEMLDALNEDLLTAKSLPLHSNTTVAKGFAALAVFSSTEWPMAVNPARLYAS